MLGDILRLSGPAFSPKPPFAIPLRFRKAVSATDLRDAL